MPVSFRSRFLGAAPPPPPPGLDVMLPLEQDQQGGAGTSLLGETSGGVRRQEFEPHRNTPSVSWKRRPQRL